MTKDSSLNTMYQFKLPDLGEGIHEAEIVHWQVKEGDTVTINQTLLEVQTDKALVEIPAPVAGTIKEIRVEEGTTAHLGDVLVAIQPESKSAYSPAPDDSSSVVSATAKVGLAGPGQRVLAAPAVRKMALRLGISLHRVPGSGPNGRVLPSDVRTFAEQQAAPQSPSQPTYAPPNLRPPNQPPPTPALSQPKSSPEPPRQPPEQSEAEPLSSLRRRIAERLDEAWRIPHVTSFAEVDVARLVKLRRQLKDVAAEQNVSLTYLPFIIKAVVQTLKVYPDFNARLDTEQQQIVRHRHYHIGIATAIPEGLLVPVIRHADQASLRQLAQELTRLTELARDRKLSADELSGSTFSITNFGSAGGEQGTPIINPPEVAILGCGRIEPKPVVVKGKVKVRPVLPLSLSFDHRLLDGVAAAQFLTHLKTLLNKPKRLMLDL